MTSNNSCYFMWNGLGNPHFTILKKVDNVLYNFCYHDYEWVSPEIYAEDDYTMKYENVIPCTVYEYLTQSELVKRMEHGDFKYINAVKTILLKEEFYKEVLE